MATHSRKWHEWGKLRRNRGALSAAPTLFFATCIALALSLPGAPGDSPAEARFLDNGVRAWNRSGLETQRPPAPGARRFAPARRAPAPAPDTAWFWREVAPGARAGAPARWGESLDMLRARRAAAGGLYSREALARIARRWSGPVAAEARRRGLSEALVLAVIAVESAGRARARSPKGAQGLMQLIPATARRFAVADPYDPAQNVRGGAAYLDFLLRRFGGDPILALAGYNAGEGAVARHGGVPPYAETRAYVVRVLDAVVAAESLCPNPPDTPRARCPLGAPNASR